MMPRHLGRYSRGTCRDNSSAKEKKAVCGCSGQSKRTFVDPPGLQVLEHVWKGCPRDRRIWAVHYAGRRRIGGFIVALCTVCGGVL